VIRFHPGELTIVPPPPLVTLVGVLPVTRRKQPVTRLILTFSGPLDAAQAQNTRLHSLVIAGRNGLFVARSTKIIKLRSAHYGAASNTVTLVAAKPFALTKPIQLQVNGQAPSGLEDSYG
jgi:hypothetical protein